MSDPSDHASLMKSALREIKNLRAALAEAKAAAKEPIAIVGIGCRFPGGANDPASYWRLLENGVDAITEVPSERWDKDALFDPDPDAPGKMYTKHGGFLEEIDRFDAQFFGVSPLDAANMDPQQRLLLEVAWEALENAGQIPGAVARTGVYVGSFMDDYLQLNFHAADRRDIDAYNTLGLLRGLAAGRLAYALDLHGPALQMDTACSSSLLAAHLACQALRNRECDLALAGGVNLILAPEVTIGLCRMKAMAADGRCKSFDASADGYVRGEGCGIVVLKRLSDAIADDDHIHAVIRGSAVNHDGRSNGLTAPNGTAQRTVIRDALADAGVDPAQIQVIEAHGTGTSLGDPIEAMALGDVLGRGRRASNPLLVGSVKSNFGHLESAAGAAALIKMALALTHAAVPPSLHFENPNPHIPWATIPIAVPTQLAAWPEAERRIGGVSSFGMSGTNVHLIVEEAPRSRARRLATPEPAPNSTAEQVNILTISAATPAALDALVTKYAEQLVTADDASLHDICDSSNRRRKHFEQRLAIVVDSARDAAAQLKTASSKSIDGKRPKIAFLFSGQGSNLRGVAEALYRERPVFRHAIDECAEILRPFHATPLVELLLPPRSSEQTTPRDNAAQTTLFAFQYALAMLWKSWGIVPDAVLGHSAGEYAAACVAGIFRVDDALRLLAERERLMNALPGESTTPAVFYDENRALEIVNQHIDERSTNPPRVSFVSTVTGDLATSELATAAYWHRQIRQPDRFADGIRKLRALDHRIFIEIGPQPTLTAMAQHILDDGAVVETGVASKLALLPSLRSDRSAIRQLSESLASLYEHGIEPDWTAVHGKGTNVPLPTYPFQRKRFWIEPKRRKSTMDDAPDRLVRRVPLPFSDDAHFESHLRDGSPSYLRDHQLAGTIVVPAATYITMALEGARALHPGSTPTLRDLAFTQALTVPSESERTLHLVVSKRENEPERFRFASLTSETEPFSDSSWTTHCHGAIDVTPNRESTSPDVAAIMPRYEGIDGTNDIAVDSGFTIGPSFRWTVSIRRGEREVLCRMESPLPAAPTSSSAIHPGLVDSCLRTLALCLSDEQRGDLHDEIYAPFAIDTVSVLTQPQPTARLHCHARASEISADRIVGDVVLFDDDGTIIMTIAGLEARRTSVSSLVATRNDSAPHELLAIEWQPAEPTAPFRSRADTQWLVLGESSSEATELVSLLDAHGVQVHVGGEAIAHLLRDAETKQSRLQVVYFCSTDQQQSRAGSQLLALLQTLDSSSARANISVVTRGTQAARDRDRVDPQHAWVIGLGRVVALESPRLRWMSIDLDPSATAPHDSREELSLLLAHCNAGEESEVAIRDRVALVPRLVKKPLESNGSRDRQFDAGRSYVITGAFGSIGSQIARWMAQHGARHLVLVGRTASRSHPLVAELESLGVRVLPIEADIADSESVARNFRDAAFALPPIAGIMHAAGVVDDALLGDLTWERFERVFAPKIAGSWNLHVASAELALDFFVCFSSAASLIGSRGQASYAAANSFMDALMQHRRGRGLPGLAINWGAWSDTGMAARLDARERERMRASGIESLDATTALEILGRLLRTDAAQIGVIAADWSKLLPSMFAQPPRMFANLASTPEPKEESVLQQFARAPREERRALLERYLRALIVSVMGRDPFIAAGDDASFFELGMDSLLSLDLRNRLQRDLDRPLPSTIAFEYPAIGELAAHLIETALPAELFAETDHETLPEGEIARA